jgi:hypothetical protein
MDVMRSALAYPLRMPPPPKGPSTKPPPPSYADASASEQRIALSSRTTTTMRPLPPLKGRPRIIMDAEELGWLTLTPSARALLSRLDGKATVLDLAEGSDAEVDAVFEVLRELQEAGVIAYDE